MRAAFALVITTAANDPAISAAIASVRISGATVTVCPAARSVSAVRDASDSGRVNRMCMSWAEEIGWRERLQLRPRIGPERNPVPARAGAAGFECLAAIGPQDHAAKAQSLAIEHRITRDRRTAR